MNLDLAASASAEDWVKASRIKEKDAKSEAKRLADLKQKQLDEEEDELLEQSSSLYNASHLKGLKVMHAMNDFEEGQEVVLTLKDTSILQRDEDGKILGLNEEGDELENVNLADKDRRLERESKKRRLNQPVYSALDDYEFQNGAPTGTRAPLLPQYERERKASAKFELGAEGVAAPDPNAAVVARAAASAANVENLLSMSKEASDYYSTKEYTTFSKAKKGKKNKAARRKDVDDEEEGPQTVGVVDSGAIESKEMDVEAESQTQQAGASTVTRKVPAPMKFQSLDLDEDDPDMAQALAKARRLALQAKQREQEAASVMAVEGEVPVGMEDRGASIARALAAKIDVSCILRKFYTFVLPCRYRLPFEPFQPKVERAAGADDGDDNIDVDGRRADGTLVFNSTTEFSTRLQAHLSEKARTKTEALMRDLERRADRDRDDVTVSSAGKRGAPRSRSNSINGNGTGRAMSVDGDDDSRSAEGQERKSSSKRTEADISGTMEDFEGVSDMDASGAETGSDDGSGDGDDVGDDQLGFVHRQPLVAQGMAATLALLKGSGELRKADQLAGRAKDSRQYDPSNTDLGIKLEYRDEFGRKLTQKEAFRQLSYKFHGYGPSQKKKEKRLKVMFAVSVLLVGAY
jgi:U4/U6.U5 tri-snRNP-associated protein 1